MKDFTEFDLELIVGVYDLKNEYMTRKGDVIDLEMDILIAAKEALSFKQMINTEVDKLTFGEFSRRYEKSRTELIENLKIDWPKLVAMYED